MIRIKAPQCCWFDDSLDIKSMSNDPSDAREPICLLSLLATSFVDTDAAVVPAWRRDRRSPGWCQIGSNWNLLTNWAVVVDARFRFIAPDVSVDGTPIGRGDINPLAWGETNSYRF